MKAIKAVFEKLIFRRDPVCAVCRKKTDIVHHITTQGSSRNAGRYNMLNGAGLCHWCHALVHGVDFAKRRDAEWKIKNRMMMIYGPKWEQKLFESLRKPLQDWELAGELEKLKKLL